MARAAWILGSFISLELGVVVAFLTWSLLPEGRYPVVLAGLPALPFVWGGWYCLKKGGLVSETGEVAMPAWLLFLLALGVLAVAGMIAVMFLA